jgi:demethylmenaquinone methyltransferase/2-methoxy-6-polyprenyl-1,4-benzoquinol methylase
MDQKLYPDSKVEVRGFEARHYDRLMDLITLGAYPVFLKRVFGYMHLKPGQRVLDLGAGTGRNTAMIADRIGEDGEVWGVDIGDDMSRQFHQRCDGRPNCHFLKARIDQSLDLDPGFDLIFISFVIHGLPHDNRLQVLENVRRLLRPGGWFVILDYNQWKDPGAFKKFMFTRVECPYSFDFIKRDWHEILARHGLYVKQENLFFFNVVNLMQARKE